MIAFVLKAPHRTYVLAILPPYFQAFDEIASFGLFSLRRIPVVMKGFFFFLSVKNTSVFFFILGFLKLADLFNNTWLFLSYLCSLYRKIT